MTYLLIAVLLLVALSPLLSMMPSRRQRELANLRQAAATSGLYVQFDTREGDNPPAILYGCRRQRGDRAAAAGIYVRVDEGWQSRVGEWAAERLKLLDALPAGVSEIREDSGGVTVVWDEQGSAEEVQEIATVLRAILGRHY